MRHIISGLAIAALVATAGTAVARPGTGGGNGMGGGQMNGNPSMQMRPMSSPAAANRPTTTQPATTPTNNSSAATQSHTTGQPNASCEDTPNTPGNSASAPGSAFNPNGVAGTKYAGEQPQNSKNPVSVSQYDAACAHQPH